MLSNHTLHNDESRYAVIKKIYYFFDNVALVCDPEFIYLFPPKECSNQL